jgi:hypothetical protein
MMRSKLILVVGGMAFVGVLLVVLPVTRGLQSITSLTSIEAYAAQFIPLNTPTPDDERIGANAARMLEEGRHIFRHDTFGSEAFWSGRLRLHQVVAGARFGGVGTGLTPAVALAVGLKVDSEALPPSVTAAIRSGTLDLNDPANTMVLLQQKAVVGLTGRFDGDRLTALGIQCALCHSTVDDFVAAGIGRRLDGWPNRDLNVGAIINLSPDLAAFTSHLGVDDTTVRRVFASWGPGRFDAELILDGKAFRPDGRTAATLIPAAFGLAGVNLHTYTGWGSVTHWNAFVANLEMMGSGTFFDPRLNDAARFPLAARAGFGNVRKSPDLITSKLPALHYYQLSISAPTPPLDSFSPRGADRGEHVFNTSARCSTCHVPPLFTEPGWPMHTAAQIGIDDFQANRSPDVRYRTTPLRGLFARTKGGFYHDGRFATLRAVVDHYDRTFDLRLSEGDKLDLVEYLKSL